MSKSQIDELVKDHQGMRFFQQERLILATTERICEIMEQDGISRKSLAEALGTSKSFVTQLLDGSRNMTLRTLSDVFLELGYAVHIQTGSITATIKAPVQLSVNVDDANWPEPIDGWDTSLVGLTFNIGNGKNDDAAA
jgi:transcriptional regulator with XRE-family HTH domain